MPHRALEPLSERTRSLVARTTSTPLVPGATADARPGDLGASCLRAGATPEDFLAVRGPIGLPLLAVGSSFQCVSERPGSAGFFQVEPRKGFELEREGRKDPSSLCTEI